MDFRSGRKPAVTPFAGTSVGARSVAVEPEIPPAVAKRIAAACVIITATCRDRLRA